MLKYTYFTILMTSLALSACLSKECTLMGCVLSVELTFTSQNGEPITNMTGTVDVDEQSFTIHCDGTPSSPTTSGSGATGSVSATPDDVRNEACSQGIKFFSLDGYDPYDTTPIPMAISVTTPTGQGFEGIIEPSYRVIEDFNGEGCGTCARLEATIVLTD